MTRSDMLFIAEMSARYHRRRAAFLERISMLMTLINLIGGAGAFLSLIGGNSTLVAKCATLVITIIGIIQAVYRIDGAASDNRQWLSEWLGMLNDIYSKENPTAQDISKWIEKRHQIEAKCICELRALQEDCYNKTMMALNRGGDPVKIKWFQKLFMQIYSFENGF